VEFHGCAYGDLDPLTWLTFGLDHAVWGTRPIGYHLTNIVLHAANTFLVAVLAARLQEQANGLSKGLSGKRHSIAAVCLTAALFGAHPLRVESVAWISERKDVLCAFFYLLSLLSYVAHTDGSDQGRGSRYSPSRSFVFSFLFFCLALASKPMAVTLPVVLLLLDWYPLGRTASRSDAAACVREKIPFFALSVIVSLITVFTQKAAGYMTYMNYLSLSTRALVAMQSIEAYVVKIILPIDLLPLYPYPDRVSIASSEFFLPVIFFISVSIVCLLYVRTSKIAFAACAFFIVALIPTLGIVQVGAQPMADRYSYLPSIGPCLLIGVAAGRLWDSRATSLRGARIIRGTLALAAIGYILVLSYQTTRQIAVWKDSITLWSAVIDREPRLLPIAYSNRGIAYKDRGAIAQALADFNTAIALDPKSAFPYVKRGIIYGEQGFYARSINDFTLALAADPWSADAYIGRGLSRERLELLDDALSDYNAAVALRPGSGDAHFNRGVVYERMNLPVQAADDYTRAIEINPYDASAYFYRGSLYGRQGALESAIRDYEKACAFGEKKGCAALQGSRT
jgi:Tfp pilus assembly protein PilF